ncbi:hypothetical protein PROFUN_02837 [Planoprotostelium fungivorum]|uniref:Uncharacterized protein n=1 Tax=Planoprotostelium fungivorum TaxID=1890364 RepID=A0A2P6NXQ6_9EUKA|nr:hypothetical protein PROFUN_02837 [Planoprotostelium fungivorum]
MIPRMTNKYLDLFNVRDRRLLRPIIHELAPIDFIELSPNDLHRSFDITTSPPIAPPSEDENQSDRVDVHLVSTQKRERDETVDTSKDVVPEKKRCRREEDSSVCNEGLNILSPPHFFGDNEFGVAAPAVEGFVDQYAICDQMEFTLLLRQSEILTGFY